jgi:hypothetical protein
MFGNHISSMYVSTMVPPLLAHIDCSALSMVMVHRNLHSIDSPIGKRCKCGIGILKEAHSILHTLHCALDCCIFMCIPHHEVKFTLTINSGYIVHQNALTLGGHVTVIMLIVLEAQFSPLEGH